MPLSYWTHACITAVYLIRLPTPTLNNDTPYFRLFGKPPNYQKLRSFGCLCYPWLKPYTTHKLQPKSILCVFFGYSPTQSAYYCLDTNNNCIYTSRHVHFVENTFRFADKTPLPPPISTLINEWAPLSLDIDISIKQYSISTPQYPTSCS